MVVISWQPTVSSRSKREVNMINSETCFAVMQTTIRLNSERIFQYGLQCDRRFGSQAFLISYNQWVAYGQGKRQIKAPTDLRLVNDPLDFDTEHKCRCCHHIRRTHLRRYSNIERHCIQFSEMLLQKFSNRFRSNIKIILTDRNVREKYLSDS